MKILLPNIDHVCSKPPSVVVTDHAYKRARQRLRWNRDALNRMAVRAFTKGIRHNDTNGYVKRYLDTLWTEYQRCDNIRIYGDNVYMFCKNSLVTIYRINNNLIKYIKHYK